MSFSLHYCPDHYAHFAGTTKFKVTQGQLPTHQVHERLRTLAEQHRLNVQVDEVHLSRTRQRSQYGSDGVTRRGDFQNPKPHTTFKVKTLGGRPEQVRGFEADLLDQLKIWLQQGTKALRLPTVS